MSKSVTLLLALAFLSGTLITIVEPVSAAEPDSWTTKAPVPQVEGMGGAVVVEGKIYVMGNLFTYEYDPVTDVWVEKTPVLTSRANFGVAVYQNRIYVMGGSVDWTQEIGAIYCGLNEVYDPLTDTWETMAPMPTNQSNIAASVVNGKIHLMGPESHDVYDVAANTWSTKEPMPHPVYGFSPVVVDDNIFIIRSNLTQIYNPESDSWSLGASPPTVVPSGAAGCATTGVMAPTRIYVIGGSRGPTYESLSINQVYDPKNDSWMLGAPMLTARSGLTAAVVNDEIYLIGGSISMYSLSQANELYTPIGYGTSDPPDDVTAPEIAVSSPECKTYYASNVTLCFSVNESASLMKYSLDGLDNVTVAGNITLVGLSVGLHNVTVYAWDEVGNVGASEIVTFTIAEPEPESESFPAAPVALASIASGAVVSAALLVYFKKRRH